MYASARKGFVTPEDRELIRSRVPLEDLLPDYNVQLVAAGHRLKGLCPFHQEKTPSFSVDRDKQLYHCFGCKASGDVFRFIQEFERVEFPEAVEILARRAGVVLQLEVADSGKSRRRQALYDALERAATVYHRVLTEDPRGEVAREYLRRRGVSEDMWKRFRLGFAPPGWSFLLDAARAAKIPMEVLDRAGLVSRKDAPSGREARFYDRFRNRVMFPIGDAQGRIIGFGARTLGDDQPKYLNTSKTELFDKSQVLYGLQQSKPGIHREKTLAIVEGYTDVIAAHQAGLDFFVASLGTAFTSDNARSLRRLAEKIWMVMDGDSAGQSAMERSLELLVAEDLDVRVYSVEGGKDPCDAVSELGGEAFRAEIETHAVGLFEFKWQRTVEVAERNAASPQAKAAALDEFLGLLELVSNPVTRSYIQRGFVERLERYGLREADIDRRLEEIRKRRKKSGRSPGLSGAASGAGRGPGQRVPPRDGGGSMDPGEPPVARVESTEENRQAGGRRDLRQSADSVQESLQEDRRTANARRVLNDGRRPLIEVVLECLVGRPEQAAEMWSEVPPSLFQGPFGEPLGRAVEEQMRCGSFSGVRLVRELEDSAHAALLVELLDRVDRGDRTKGERPSGRRLRVRDVRARRITTFCGATVSAICGAGS